MPTNKGGVREVTAPVQFSLEGDRLHFTIVSGECARSFSITFNRARRAIASATLLLDERDRTQATVRRLHRKASPLPHG
jgi:hypothetical protein